MAAGCRLIWITRTSGSFNRRRADGLNVRPPDKWGAFRFSVKDGDVIYGLGAIKGLEGPTSELVGSRKLGGAFMNLLISVAASALVGCIVVHLKR